MKKLLLIALAAVCSFGQAYSQCTPVDCRPGVDIPSYGGVCSDSLPQGEVNQAVNEEVTFIIGGSCFNTLELDSSINLGIVWVQSVFNFAFSGLPDSINVLPNETSYVAAGSDALGCIGVTGTPTQAGIFAAGIDFTVRVRLFPGGCGNPFLSGTADLPFNFALELTVLPDASFAPLAASYCGSDPPVTLNPTGTLGGTFSGPGVAGNTFDPALAGPGIHEIIYSVSAQEGLAVAPAQNSSSQFVEVTASAIYYADTDNDTYGDPNNSTESCEPAPPPGFVENDLDCDDDVQAINPDAEEVCDGVDNDCDGDVDGDDDETLFAVCQDVTVELDNSGIALLSPTSVDGGSSDACGTASFTVSPSGFTCNELGPNVVTLVATAGGNISSCTATATVEDPTGACSDPCDPDNTPPTAVCQDHTVQLNPNGIGSMAASDIDGGSSDACGPVNISASQTAFTCADVGANVVVLTATDGNSNTDDCNATVNVVDEILPALICQDVTVQLDGSGFGALSSDQFHTASDICGIVEVIADYFFTCEDLGSFFVLWQVEDVNGNTNACDVMITIEDPTGACIDPCDPDETDPTAVCQDHTVQLNPNGVGSMAASDIDGGSSDACGPVTLTASPTSFGCADVGAHPVTLTVTDGNGNTDNCTASVTVEDNVPPAISCIAGLAIELLPLPGGGGAMQIFATDLLAAPVTEACGATGLSLSRSLFTCADLGTVPVILTVTDVNGNSSTCQVPILVQDNLEICADPCNPDLTPPTAVCLDFTVQLDGAGNGSLNPADIDGGSSDACGPVTLTAAPSSFGCADVGANAVVLTVTDAAGITASCNANVTVEDIIPPTLVCEDVTVELDAFGGAGLSSDQFHTASDACGILVVIADFLFTCDDIGEIPISWSVEDVYGNTNSCSVVITIEDPLGACTSPDCTTPENLYATNITFFQATLGWDAVPGAIRYQAQGRIKNSIFGLTKTRIVTNNQFRTNALFPFLTYEFRVRTDCPGTGWTPYSDWFDFTLNPFVNHASVATTVARNIPVIDLFDTDGILKAYPNPTSGLVYLQYAGAELRGTEVMVTDLAGRNVHHEVYNWNPGEDKVIDLGGFDNGMYLVNLVKDGIYLKTIKVFLSK